MVRSVPPDAPGVVPLRRLPGVARAARPSAVAPAEAGMARRSRAVPAFAGMAARVQPRLCTQRVEVPVQGRNGALTPYPRYPRSSSQATIWSAACSALARVVSILISAPRGAS